MDTMLKTLSGRVMELGPLRNVAAEGNWRVAVDDNRVMWLALDRPGKAVNVIDRPVLEELNQLIDRIEAERPVAVVIRGAKSAGFAAGADINQFVGASVDEIRGMLGQGHIVLDRLAALLPPTIAIVHGHCLGGGLELALACKFRLAVPGASLGFPEVMLGLHPGLGGTFRATAVADPVEAMTIMLTGKSVDAKRARSMGLVDDVVEERHLQNAVQAVVSGVLRAPRKGMRTRAFSLGPARRFAASQMRKKAAETAPEAHYPAPYRLIDNWEKYGGDEDAMRKAELESFAELVETPTAQNLIRCFFLRETMRGLKTGKSGVSHVHVVGAGTMGGDIAAWAARQGFVVTLQDVQPEPIGRAMASAAKMLQATLKDPLKVRDALDRLVPDMKGLGLRDADIVIEAVPEKLDLKARIYADIEPKLKEGAILATNTSALPLEQLAEKLTDPSRFVGLHFFNPVSRMQLVEIVSHKAVAPETARRALDFAVELQRLPAPVQSAPGFLVNRALTPYMAEALLMVGEGIPKERIDARAEAFGMPMGPVELADRVGLDVAVEVSRSLTERLDTGFPPIPEWLENMVREGRLGVKTKGGLYEYDDGKPKKASLDSIADKAPDDPDLEDRLILPMLNALVASLREGVVSQEDIADGAMVFGTGFAPFRGGPLHYARQRGVGEIVTTMRRLEEKHGRRFAPDAGWESMQ
ncbi:fatty-acid oxidation protein subunit alpha [Aureimonas fodinaquatilis]|uniref:enoyl-CoA hydratase n=1 Tax=Aureimonas fodinaquatilis TaxID=2565783 RepID=A0A5B0E2V8_9HYPH|nr:3-hydroxyacyl-CoA dehydrogenase NAD-binding domain-containing protein [Aureimonas fodinaquatilis]KAA0972465.1 fatty-acid oxidation protein subunit alpha [Aureimonas fodinaquatilis]